MAQIEKNEKPTYRERLQGRYPDMPAQTDEDFAAMSEKYLDDTESELSRYRDSEAAVSELIKSDPEFEAIVTDMLVNGLPFRVAVVKNIPIEDLTPQEGDDDYQGWQQAKSQRLEKAAKMAAQQKEIAENEVASSKLFNDYVQEKGMSEAEQEEFLSIINDALFALLYKKIDRKFLDLCYKGSRFDKAVEEAEQVGETNGRNAAIEAKKAASDNKAQGDGIPGSAGGAGAMAPQRKVKRNPFFDGLRTHEEF